VKPEETAMTAANHNPMPYAAALPMPDAKPQVGKYGPIAPKTPAHGFTIIGDIKPGKAQLLRQMARERAASASPRELYELLKPLTLHYARWVLINNDTQLMYQAIFDTDFELYVEDAHRLFMKTGLATFFECMVGFPDDWKTNIPAFVQFFRKHQVESIFEFASYPGTTVSEVEKALEVRRTFSSVLDAMQ
jgi:hypothetical protein